MLILEGLVCLLMTCFVVLMLAVAVLCAGVEPVVAGRAAGKADGPVGGLVPVPSRPDEIDAMFAVGDVAGLVRLLWNSEVGQAGLSNRVRAADALGRLGPEALAAVPALQAVAIRDESELVRKSAAYALLLILPRESFGARRP